jgi:hypothetical protein
MTLSEAEKIKRSLEEVSVDLESHSWGPTYEIAEREQREALRIIRREIRRLRQEESLENPF